MTLNRNFREFIVSLNASRVRYLVVGGYAVAFHGHPRYTKDLDVWVEATVANARNLLSALDRFGFGGLGLKEGDFTQAGQVLQLGHPPERIDIATSLSGIRFEDCYKEGVEVELDGIPVRFVDLENLKKNKRATGRHQDLADLEQLEEPKPDKGTK